MTAWTQSDGSTFGILLIGGSIRQESINSAVLRTAQVVAPEGITTVRFGGLGGLPHFNPDADEDPLYPAVADLRSQIRAADGLLFSTPEYAGALPGSFKNLLDWTVGDDREGSIYEKPVAWINASPRGAVNAHESLRRVLGYLKADIVEPACIHLAVTPSLVGEAGVISDPGIRERIAGTLSELARQRGDDSPRRADPWTG